MLSFKNLASFTLFATLASFTAAAAVVEQRSSQVTVSAYAQENCQAVAGAPDNTSSWSTTIYDNGDDCTNVGPNQPIGFDTGSISAGGK
ncbi:hypothetical protein B7494_g3242 [Chlorociboria aeruginascens]|nr:hypothetical protein B7494_g3242 [Chlorociboria aeruginascens]